MQEKEELKQLRRSAREAERLLQAQPETPAAVSAQQQAELDVKSARILELERTLFETYRAPAREATDAEAAEYVENLKKEVVHLTGMVRTVGDSSGFIFLKFIHSPPTADHRTREDPAPEGGVEERADGYARLPDRAVRGSARGGAPPARGAAVLGPADRHRRQESDAAGAAAHQGGGVRRAI
jgi:hypothetical protein